VSRTRMAHQRVIRLALADRPPLTSLAGCTVRAITTAEAEPIIVRYEWLGTLARATVACYGCTAPGFLDTEQAAIVSFSVLGFDSWRRGTAISGNTQIAAPLVKSSLRASTALDFRRDPHQHRHAALARASARACAGVRWPRRSMSHSAL